MDFIALAQHCAPTVAPQTMAAVVRVESSFNPYAIGVVGGWLERQPANLAEAVATAVALEQGGWNFSVGIAQVNRFNLPKYRLSYETAFEPCGNLRAGSKILEDCYVRASRSLGEHQALQAAISCYYSGNFARGFRPESSGQPSYVQKVLASAGAATKAIPVVPTGQTGTSPKSLYDKTAGSNVPTALKGQFDGSNVLPSDHSTVLTRTAGPENGSVVRLKPLATGAVKEAATPDSEAKPTDKPSTLSSAIVF